MVFSNLELCFFPPLILCNGYASFKIESAIRNDVLLQLLFKKKFTIYHPAQLLTK